MKKFRQSVQGAICIVLCTTLVLLSGCSGKKPKDTQLTIPTAPAPAATVPTEPSLPEGYVEYDGTVYRPRENLTTLLMLGLDKFDYESDELAYTNHMQSDFLVLMVLDEDNKTCSLLHLNRDTMTEIRRLGIGGGNAGTFVGQLALAHTYGSGGSDSCYNAIRAVSDFLGGVTIDHYLTLTMDAVSVINDALGGIRLKVLDDMSHIDPALKRGALLTLKGDQALLYVRERFTMQNSSNLRRMERQQQYMNAFYVKLMEKLQDDDNFLGSVMMQIPDSFTSDCTVSTLEALCDKVAECEMQPIVTYEGKAVTGEQYIEFYPDEDSVRQAVVQLFYEEAN